MIEITSSSDDILVGFQYERGIDEETGEGLELYSLGFLFFIVTVGFITKY